MSKPSPRIAFALVATLSAAALAGCESSSGAYSYSNIARNITPEMSTLTERPVDVDRHIAVNNNQNLRMMNNDWGRIFYTHQPSRLSPYPVYGTSGQPW